MPIQLHGSHIQAMSFRGLKADHGALRFRMDLVLTRAVLTSCIGSYLRSFTGPRHGRITSSFRRIATDSLLQLRRVQLEYRFPAQNELVVVARGTSGRFLHGDPCNRWESLARVLLEPYLDRPG